MVMVAMGFRDWRERERESWPWWPLCDGDGDHRISGLKRRGKNERDKRKREKKRNKERKIERREMKESWLWWPW